MKRFVLTLVMFLFGNYIFAQNNIIDTLAPATGIDSAFCTLGSDGKWHLRAVLNPHQIKTLEDEAVRLVNEFNQNVANLWKPWTDDDRRKFTAQERDSFKNETEEATKDQFISKAEKFTTFEKIDYSVFRRNGIDYFKDQFGRERRAIGEIYTDQYGGRRITIKEDVLHKPARIQITSLNNPQGYWREVKKYLNNIKNSHLYDRVSFDAGGITVSDRLVEKSPGHYVGTICYYQDFRGYRGDGMAYTDRTERCVTYHVYITQRDGMIVWNIKLGDIRATATKEGSRK